MLYEQYHANIGDINKRPNQIIIHEHTNGIEIYHDGMHLELHDEVFEWFIHAMKRLSDKYEQKKQKDQ